MDKIFKFEPHYFERVWGGQAFKDILGRNIHGKQNLGESWEIVDREDCQSVLINPNRGTTTLRELLKYNHLNLMGPGWNMTDKFPILVKWLDCHERLSLQVHPPESIAATLSGEPKTENWYVAHASKEAGLYVGLKSGTSKQDFMSALMEKNLQSVCHRINSCKGDSILVESGRLHAIDGGNLILEIQQNSDTTYRVYDWERVDEDGCSRKLHIEESLKCINFNDFEPDVISQDHSPVQILAESSAFRIRKFTVDKPMTINLKKVKEQCMILNPLFTDIIVGSEPIYSGTLAISPFSEKCQVCFKEPGELIVTDNFFIPQK